MTSQPPPLPPRAPTPAPPPSHSAAANSVAGSGGDPLWDEPIDLIPDGDTFTEPPPIDGGGAFGDGGVPKVRDRVVVLGRRRAGKTIYMARLYERLWTAGGEMHMRALGGGDHLYFLGNIKRLREGAWPAATGGSTHATIEIDFEGRKHLMVILDYAGEVFHRAFVEGIADESSVELLDHVDRAAAVILLVDPGVAVAGDVDEFADDDFGMAAAIRRIREWPGGEAVPIALVLTKIDQHKHRLREAGGLVPFVQRHYGPLLRAIGRVRVFGAAAVRQTKDGVGNPAPDMTREPVGLVEPLRYCLQEVGRSVRAVEREERRAEMQEQAAASHRAETSAKRGEALLLTAIWIGVPILLVLVAAITIFLAFR
jgi:GTPase SAR1 family protein